MAQTATAMAPAKKKKTVELSFGDKVKLIREAKNLSQAQLAEAAGVSDGYISLIENNIRGKRPSKDIVLNLARALGVHPDELTSTLPRFRTTATADRLREYAEQRESFTDFVNGDPYLTESDKQVLIGMYQRMVRP